MVGCDRMLARGIQWQRLSFRMPLQYARTSELIPVPAHVVRQIVFSRERARTLVMECR